MGSSQRIHPLQDGVAWCAGLKFLLGFSLGRLLASLDRLYEQGCHAVGATAAGAQEHLAGAPTSRRAPQSDANGLDGIALQTRRVTEFAENPLD